MNEAYTHSVRDPSVYRREKKYESVILEGVVYHAYICMYKYVQLLGFIIHEV